MPRHPVRYNGRMGEMIDPRRVADRQLSACSIRSGGNRSCDDA